MPFLGAHFTLTAAGAVKIGPTALPAAGREHYAGVAGADPSEAAAIAGRWLQLSAQAPFRELVAREVPKLWRRHLVRQADALLDGVDPRHFVRWGPPGIRAQLFDRRQSRLVDDFTIAAAPGVVHVLNAVSPGFTASLALADTLADRVLA